jgi:hypothetical protein
MFYGIKNKYMIIGYSISGPDNNSYLFEDGWGKTVCEVLDFIENREKYVTEKFRVKRSNFNLSYTYDSALIVSQKFKDFCRRNKYDGLHFYQLKKQKELYLMKSENIIEFDSKRRNTQFDDYQESCKRYNSVAGANPVCLDSNEELKDGIYRTDIEFGSGYELSPLILVGVSTYEKMKIEKFNDIDFEPILDKYEWEEK